MKKAGWEQDYSNLHTISLKNIQRLIFNLHLNTSNNLLLYKHNVLMTMTFDPTGPGSRVKASELVLREGVHSVWETLVGNLSSSSLTR